MRIHHVAPHFHPDQGGVETHVLRLSQFVVAAGHEVVVHTSRRSQAGARLPEEDAVDGIRIMRYPNALRLGYYLTLFRPRIDSADVVHLHGYGLLANDWTERRYGADLPFVYSLHHGVARTSPSALAAIRKAVYDRTIGLKTLRGCQALLAASEADRAWLASRGFPAGRLDVVPSGLDDDAFVPGQPERILSRLPTARYLMYLGRLHREKSVDQALRALAALPDRDVGLVVVGPDAGARRELEALVSSLGLGSRVRFTGPVDETTKRDLIAGADALVLPSSYEAQGIVILEAWAQGRPVIASQVGGVPYLVHDGTDGLLYPWGDVDALRDRMAAVLADANRARDLGVAGRTRAEREFRWSALGARVVSWYEAASRPGERA